MTPQQQQVADLLSATNDWIKAREIAAKTGVKAPRMIVWQLREMGYDIWTHQAGQNSKGYLFVSEPEQQRAA